MQYTIGAGNHDEQVKFTSSNSLCNFEVLVYEKISTVWTIHNSSGPDGLVVSVVKNTSIVLSPGQFIYDVTINTSNISLDPGTGFAGLTKNYKVSAATPNHATAAGGATSPKPFLLDIEFLNECRDLVIEDQTLTMMENIIGQPAVTQVVPTFNFNPNTLDCGTQTISVYEDGSSPAYSSFLAASAAMTISLQSSTESHAGDYYVKVEVTFSKFPSIKMRNAFEFLVRLKKSCA